MKNYKYLDTITVIFVVVLLVSNIASSKISQIGKLTLDGGTILFPLSYIFNDILTEVYGYKTSRKVIWLGFFSAILASLVFAIVAWLPSASSWNNQEAYLAILGQTPRIVLASLLAYLCGEFLNSFILAKMKIWTSGKMLWTRTIGSTIIGELADSIIFVCIAFMGVYSKEIILALIISNYIFKTVVEVIFTPITYKIVRFLKHSESEDYYDTKTNFNPLALH
jgi:uncharacterized integral membrane protein (TIGR00697 family)